MRDFKLDYEKFKTLVHYICWTKGGSPSDLGATKLNKILYYSDMYFFKKYGDPITGCKYIKREWGPCPKYSDLNNAINELCNEKKLIFRESSTFNKKEYIALEEADIDIFNANEISLIDRIAHNICNNHTAKSISDHSHGLVWKNIEIGDDIPYESIFLEDPAEVDENDIKWVKEIVAKN